MRILMTGIHGSIGASLVDALKNEHTIFGLDMIASEIEGVEKMYTCSELTNIPNMDVVIHLAGKAVDTNNLSDALEYFESNAGLTRKIFKWFTQSSAQTFIYFSSVKAAADQLSEAVLTEDAEPKPFGALGESKLMAEKYILSEYVMNKSVYVLRPCIVIGNGSIGNKNLRLMYRMAEKGYPFPFGKFQCSRSFTTIDNLTFVLSQMLTKKIPSGVYNIADDGSLTIIEIFEIMGAVLGKQVRIWRVNKGILRLISKVGTRFHWFYNYYKYRKISSNFVVSNQKIKNALDIRKMPVSIVDGFTRAVQDYKNKINIL